MNTPPLKVISDVDNPLENPMDKFRSGGESTAGVETLQAGLPVLRIAEAKDWVRLHPDTANYWSPELCFVPVPIKGAKKDTLHLISKEIAESFLAPGRIKRFRLALASRPHDGFFLCIVPSRNLDNTYNADSLTACERAKALWVMASSMGEEGIEGYKIENARHQDAYADPKWPKQTLWELITAAFRGRMIEDEDNAALHRLIGARQNVS
jgi:hypothetical protein